MSTSSFSAKPYYPKILRAQTLQIQWSFIVFSYWSVTELYFEVGIFPLYKKKNGKVLWHLPKSHSFLLSIKHKGRSGKNIQYYLVLDFCSLRNKATRVNHEYICSQWPKTILCRSIISLISRFLYFQDTKWLWK